MPATITPGTEMMKKIKYFLSLVILSIAIASYFIMSNANEPDSSGYKLCIKHSEDAVTFVDNLVKELSKFNKIEYEQNMVKYREGAYERYGVLRECGRLMRGTPQAEYFNNVSGVMIQVSTLFDEEFDETTLEILKERNRYLNSLI